MKRSSASLLCLGLAAAAGCQSPATLGPAAGARPLPDAPGAPDAPGTPDAHVTRDAHDAPGAAQSAAVGGCPQDADAEIAAAAPRLPPPPEAERQARALALAVRAALAAEDYGALSRLVSARGVCLAASKGADCRWMGAHELAGCARSARRESWAVDSGSELPHRYSCAQAMRKIFWAHPGLATAEPSFNCFRARADNSGASLWRAELGAEVYVELFADDPEMPGEGLGWRSLWLLLAPEVREVREVPKVPKVREARRELRLVGLVSHYWSI